jgi:hypothetical protein
MDTMRISRPIHLCLTALLASCAATTPEAIQTVAMWQGVKAATPCCESRTAALQGAQPLVAFRGVFSPTTPHFDFGAGLAPFAVFSLGQTAKVLEVESPAQYLSMPHGGDGVIRYVDPRLVFVDSEGREVAGELLAQSQRATVPGGRSLFGYVRVPSSARYVVLTTDPKKNREHHVSQVRQAPAERLTSRSTNFFAFGGVMPDGHKSANYGPVALRMLPNE